MGRAASGFAATILAVVALMAGLWPQPMGPKTAEAGEAPSAQAASTGAPPDALGFMLKDMDGRAMNFGRLRGHPVIIDFWATWCPPCRKQIPELKKIYARYHKSKGLAVVGVACDTVRGDGVAAVRPFVKEFAISYPIVMADDDVLDRLGIEAIPTTLFVSRTGEVVGRMTGAGGPGELAEAAKRLLVELQGEPGPERKSSPRKRENGGAGTINIHYVSGAAVAPLSEPWAPAAWISLGPVR